MTDPAPVLLQQALFASVALLLVAVTGGIGYLTFSEWRDRRRRSRSEPVSKAKRNYGDRRRQKP